MSDKQQDAMDKLADYARRYEQAQIRRDWDNARAFYVDGMPIRAEEMQRVAYSASLLSVVR